MLKPLVAVVFAFATRRLLWLWGLAYLVIVLSALFCPWSPQNAYITRTRPNPSRMGDMRSHQTAQQLSAICPDFTFDGPHDLTVELAPRGILEDECVAAIRNIPSLKRLFVGGYRNRPAEFRRLSEMLPRLTVWHTDQNWSHIAAAVFLILALLTLGGAMLQQLQATVTPPQARLYPNYLLPHLLVPLAFVSLAILIQAYAVREFGVDFKAAVAVQAFICGLSAALGFLIASMRCVVGPSPGRPMSLTARLGQPIINVIFGVLRTLPALAIAGVLIVLGLFPHVFESYVLGEMPRLSLGLFLAGIAFIAGSATWAPRVSVSHNEGTLGRTPSSRDAVKQRRMLGLPAIGGLQRRLNRLSDRRLGPTWLSRIHAVWLWRIHAVRAGNPSPFVSGLILIAVLAILFLVFSAIALNWRRATSLLPAFNMLFLALGGMGLMGQCFQNWWQRRNAFSLELLLPWTRRQMTISAFAAYAVDVSTVPMLIFADALACKLWFGWEATFSLVWMGALAASSLVAALTAGALWLLTLRHALFAGLVGSAGVVLLVVLVSTSIIPVVSGAAFLPLALAWLAVKLGLLAILLGVTAYHRWIGLEWALMSHT